MSELIFPTLVFWGLFSGFMGGLLGVGGGLIFVLVIPVAARSLGIPEDSMVAVTVANSLACTFFTTFSAGVSRFVKEKQVRKSALIIGFSSTLVSLIVLKYLVNPGLLPPLFFHVFFLGIVFYLILRLFLRWRQTGKKEDKREPKESNQVLWLIGLFSGIVSPLSGLGGGIVVVPVLHAMLHFPIRLAQAVSFGVIALSTLILSIFNIFDPVQLPSGIPHLGLLVLPLVLSLGPTAVLGSLLGSWVAGKLSSRLSSGILLGFLVFIFLRKILSLN